MLFGVKKIVACDCDDIDAKFSGHDDDDDDDIWTAAVIDIKNLETRSP